MNATDLVRILRQTRDTMMVHREFLIELDSVVGDGDLGLTMSDGFAAAHQKAAESTETDCGKLLYLAGKAMGSAVPSTMGTLMAAGLMQAGKALKGVNLLQTADLAHLYGAFLEGVMQLGKAKSGEKTFIDGMEPAVQALSAAAKRGVDDLEAAKIAAEAARSGYEATATMVAVHGRAATRGEASRNLKDPGAAVAMLMMRALELALS